MSDQHISRRRFIRGVAAAIPVGAALGAGQVTAQEMPQITEDDPAAKALLYVHDVADVDTSNPMAARFEASQNCDNCVQIQGAEGETWRPCAIFPGKLVNANGWCSVWVAKP
jgi:hypothetical protein